MNSEILFEKLQYTKAYRQSRMDVADWVLANPNTIPDLLAYCFGSMDELAYRATWVLEFVCSKRLDLLSRYFATFFDALPAVNLDQSVRPLAKICEMLAVAYYKTQDPIIFGTLTTDFRNKMTDCCFDWLITNQKLACKVYTISTLYYLGTEFSWIHIELKSIVSRHMHSSSAAYKARGKYILKRIG